MNERMDSKAWYEWIFLALRRAPDFRGRSSRAEYWWFTGPFLLLSFDLSWPLHIALAVPALSVTVRRLHDLGRSGWWALLAPPAWNAPWAVIGIVLLAAGQLNEDLPDLAANLGPMLAWLAGAFALISVGSAVTGVLLFRRRGEAGSNRFGDDPLVEPQEGAG